MKRSYGIDLLRMVSMLMVVTLHILGQGGVMALCPIGSPAYAATWFLQTLVLCGVNCFGMISGYVGVNSRFKVSKGLKLWLQVFFYMLSITVLFYIFKPSAVIPVMWLRAFLPVTLKQYWYVSAYFIVFIFSPFINKMLLSLERRQLWLLLAVSFFVTTIWEPLGINGVFSLEVGYSAL